MRTWSDMRDRRVPCYECTDRAPACHGKCEKYQAFRQMKDAYNEEQRRNSDMAGYAAEAKKRCHNIPSHSFRRPKRSGG